MSGRPTNWSNTQQTPSTSRLERFEQPPGYSSRLPPKSPSNTPSQNPAPQPVFYYSENPYPGQACPKTPAAFNANHSVQVVQIVRTKLGARSCRMTCPNCNADIDTKVEYNAGRMTHIIAAFLCLVGCIFCFCLPYMANDFKDSTHYCPHCQRIIGTFRR